MSQRDAFKVQKAVATQPVINDVALYYDYDRLDKTVRQEVKEIARAIKLARVRVQGDVLLVATKLLEAKENQLFPENDFEDWVRQEFGYEPRSAQYMMNLGRTYRDRADAPGLLAQMGDTVAMLVSQPSIPETVRQAIEEKAQEETLSVREARKLIKSLTRAEAIKVVEAALDEMPPHEEQRALSETPHMFRKRLPEDVTLSDNMVNQALMSVRSDRLATLVPPEPQAAEWAEEDDDVVEVTGTFVAAEPAKAKVIPPDLASTGWELKQLEANGEWYCINRKHNIATAVFYSWKGAVKEAYERQAELPVEEPPKSKSSAEEVIFVGLPVGLLRKLLVVSAARQLPGMQPKEVKELHGLLASALG